MSITLAMDPEMVRQARTYAAANGTSMSRMIRDYFASILRTPAPVRAESRGARFRALVENTSICSPKGWKFDRNEANERK